MNFILLIISYYIIIHPRICIFEILLSGWCRTTLRHACLVSNAFSYATGVVPEKFFYQKFSCIGGAGGITVLSELFVSQHRNEKLCKGTLLFSGNFLVSKKKLWIRGGISRNFLCLTLPKTFVRESYCF